MQIQTKAIYNLLRSNWLKDPSIKVEPWQVENYRELSIDELWKRLKKLDLQLDEKSFLMYAETCGTPEDLVECVWIKEDDATGQDRAYLILFELWRKLLPKNQTLSIFCDELDYRMDMYETHALHADERIQQALVELENILDENTDQGVDAKEVFLAVSEHCYHDLEKFLYDYIVDQINADNEIYASEILDGFYDYIEDVRWFDFLRARLFASTDIFEANNLLRRILEELQEEPDFDLLLEICGFLVHMGDENLFFLAIKQALPLLKIESDFQELLEIVADYYHFLDRDEKEQQVLEALKKRKSKNPSAPLDHAAHTVLIDLLKDADWSEV